MLYVFFLLSSLFWVEPEALMEDLFSAFKVGEDGCNWDPHIPQGIG